MRITRKQASGRSITREATGDEMAVLDLRGYCRLIREWDDGTLVYCGGRPDASGRCDYHRDGPREPQEAEPEAARPDDPDAGVRRILADKAADLAARRKAAGQKAAATRRAKLA